MLLYPAANISEQHHRILSKLCAIVFVVPARLVRFDRGFILGRWQAFLAHILGFRYFSQRCGIH